MLALVATMLALAAPATGEATDVTATSATLNGTADTAGTAYFEYGTGTTFALRTPDQTVTPGPVSAPVTGLTANTTYRFRLVLDGQAADPKSFTTAPNPTPPAITDQRSSAVTETSAHLSATLDPNGAATTYYFQYGRSASYGNRTARITLPADSAPVAVSADIEGLQPYTRYHWRLYATNAAGKTPGRDRTLRTARRATAITLYRSRTTVPWGRGVTLGGRVTGSGVNQMTIALEQQRFPFAEGFSEVRTTHAGRDGGYLFSVDNVWTTMRYRVVTRTLTPLASAVTTVRAAPRTTIGVRLLSRKRARIAGTIKPAITGELVLQRRLASGGWVRVRRRPLAESTRFAFKVWRTRKVNRAYRVVVVPAAGAYAKATSRKVVVSRRPARARGRRAAAG